jgi:hypothetical protein
MRQKIAFATALAVAAAFSLSGTAQAKDKYGATIVENIANPTNFHFAQSGSKVQIKPSDKAGDGGVVTQLNLKFVDCPAPGPGNDGGAAGKCGVKDTPVTDHVLDLSVNFGGADFDSIIGIKYSIEKGKGAFQATGKNKITGTAFGAFVTVVFNQPLGIGLIKLREAGTDPTDCDTIPLLPGNGCTDGGMYGLAGIVVGSDSGVTCATSQDCPLTAICTASVCANEPCTLDADCDQNGTGNGGTGQCGSNGNCCDPAFDPTCAAQVP